MFQTGAVLKWQQSTLVLAVLKLTFNSTVLSKLNFISPNYLLQVNIIVQNIYHFNLAQIFLYDQYLKFQRSFSFLVIVIL